MNWSLQLKNIKNTKLYYYKYGWVIYYLNILQSLGSTISYLTLLPNNLPNNIFFKMSNTSKNNNYCRKPAFIRDEVKWEKETTNLVSTSNFKKIQFTNHIIVKGLYNLYIKFSLLTVTTSFKIHQEYKLFFQISTSQKNLIINSTQLYRRWIHTYHFLFNLFFYKGLDLVFGPKYLKSEIQALNWTIKPTKTHFFKYNTPFFMFSDTSYGMEALTTFMRLRTLGLNTVILLDILPHKRNLYYLRIMNIFTIGLVSSNLDPWRVNFPIPTFNLNIFIQYYFLKLFIYIRQQALTSYYRNIKLLWLSF